MIELAENTLYEIMFYFIIYSFLGWVVESTFKSLLYGKLINSGFLNGPFIPIYAVGALTVYVLFYPFRENMWLLFFLGVVSMSILEYIVGYVMEKLFKTRWWDYSGNFMNIGGKICLENSIYWGIFTVSLFSFLHPFTTELIGKIPVNIGEKFLMCFIIYVIIDYTLTLIEVLNIQESIKIFLTLKESSIFIATTEKLINLKRYILKKSKRLLKTYPKLTYLSINRRLRDIVNEIKRSGNEK